MRRRGAVQRKVPCVFVTEVKEEPSAKRERQSAASIVEGVMTSRAKRMAVVVGKPMDMFSYSAENFHVIFIRSSYMLYVMVTNLVSKPFKVLATETISGKALEADIYNAIPTEKVDGTCCYVTTYKGQPYLWARLDRKPNKQAEKRFKRFLYSLEDCKEFVWNIEEDFKPVPDTWIPAKDIEFSNGNPLPDENGHMPGWVPVEKNSKQYCWHSSVINYEAEIALVLKHHADPGLLEISPVPLSEILEQTLELIGTNINANPYGLGSKKQPVHLLVPHGAFELKNPPALKQNDILSWFEGCNEGKVEGIVWHCHDGCLIKLHRHHLGLPWPLAETYLSSQPVVISFNRTKYDYDFEPKSLFHHFSNLDGQRFDRLKDIKFDV